MKVDIKHVITGALFFSHVANVNNVLITLEESVKTMPICAMPI